MDKYSVENTTKSERIQLIKQWEEEEGCDCSGMDLMEFFRDYIDGKKSIAECNAAFSAHYISEIPDDSNIRTGCGLGR
jgi:hypothetical protein